MTKFASLKKTNFHADLIERVVLRLNGGKEPTSYVYSLSTTFDDASVFRHLDFVGLRDGKLTLVHVDELPVGVRWHTHLTTVDRIGGVELGALRIDEEALSEVPTQGEILDLEMGAGLLTLFIPVSISKNIEMAALQCEDPACTADHGFGGAVKDEGVLLTFTGVDGESSSDNEVYDFATHVLGAMQS